MCPSGRLIGSALAVFPASIAYGEGETEGLVQAGIRRSAGECANLDVSNEDLNTVSILLNLCDHSETCPWDCGGDDDGNTGITDFLALLAQWGGPGACDFDGGGVGITDFLLLLANWGACP